MKNKFQCIVADPPWFFFDSLKMSDVPRGATANYNTMSIKQIKELPIKNIVDPDGAILALWVPSSLLQDGLDVMSTWGFKHKQTYIWVKTKKDIFKDLINSYIFNVESTIKSIGFAKKHWKEYFKLKNKDFSLNNILSFGMGRLFRQTHEICLIGINNNKIYKKLNNKSQRSVCFAENLKHSSKPEHLQDSLKIMFPDETINKIEIFARRQRSGWLCFGFEAPMTKGENILLSLQKLSSITEKELITINKIMSCYDEEKNKELFEIWNTISDNK